MHALRTLTLAEGRVYLRDPGTAFFALAFPTVLLLLLGLVMPGMQEPITAAIPEIAHLRGIDLYVPVALAMAITTVSLTTFPSAFGTYRERGVLRRLSTTPLPASRLLVAQVAVNVAALLVAVALALLVAVALALTVAWAVLDIVAPTRPGVVVVAFVLGALHMIALGCLLAAVVPTAGTANGLGMLLYFPLIFFAGAWMPGPLMPDSLERVAGFLPLGAAAQAMSAGWFGDGVPVQQLVVMVLWTLVLVPVAAKVFRWQ
ncbi:ABC transporter permease [Actinotalea sp. K2]|uniref:ABC transporter permease n=1 Tax=Actinotalea sp. K2 TaxID=2939438 RepID=UPI002016E56D|nr:ABC transporter permease [Actinotalea sp. K2]MCL3859574.1 ABC transporter permease [Actinotalea sp. K2]